MEYPCQCFYVNCREEIPVATWESALSTQLTTSELKTVQSFVFRKDQERSLLSLLLQKYVIRQYLALVEAEMARDHNPSLLAPPSAPLEHQEEMSLYSSSKGNTHFRIARTRENKPYLTVTSEHLACLMAQRKETFNYNVSHHGDFVGIVGHAHSLVGVDIVDISTRASWVNSLKEYIDIYRKQLSDEEVDSIMTCPSEERCYTHFYVLWSLKEAYVKAVGIGIGIDLKQVEFEVDYSYQQKVQSPLPSFTSTATSNVSFTKADGQASSTSPSSVHGTAVLRLKGERRNNWQFQFFSLDCAHIMTVGLGPPGEALDAYRTAAWPSYDSHAASASMHCTQERKDTVTDNKIQDSCLYHLPRPAALSIDHLLVPS